MLQYLFKKNVITDEDYRKYQLLWLPLTLLIGIGTCWIIYRNFGWSSELIGGLIGGSIPFVCYIIWLIRVLSSPKRLRAARLRLTDERRKVVEQEVWAQIGKVLLAIIAILIVFSIKRDVIEVTMMDLLILFYLILGYYYYRMRK